MNAHQKRLVEMLDELYANDVLTKSEWLRAWLRARRRLTEGNDEQ